MQFLNCCHFSHLCSIHSLKPILYPSFRKYLNSSWNFTFKVWEKSGKLHWKLLLEAFILLNILVFFVNDCSICSSFHLFSHLSPRHSSICTSWIPIPLFQKISVTTDSNRVFIDFLYDNHQVLYVTKNFKRLFKFCFYQADIVCISLSYLLLFHYYYCLAGTKNDKTILAGKSIHLSFCGLLYSQDIPNFRTWLHSCLKADDYDESF